MFNMLYAFISSNCFLYIKCFLLFSFACKWIKLIRYKLMYSYNLQAVCVVSVIIYVLPVLVTDVVSNNEITLADN